MNETEALRHIRTLIKACEGVDDPEALHKSMREMLAVIYKVAAPSAAAPKDDVEALVIAVDGLIRQRIDEAQVHPTYAYAGRAKELVAAIRKLKC